MYREVITELSSWKEMENRKPLLLTGAKGVGKTWCLKDFGAGFFDLTIILDFETQNYSKFLFEGNIERDRVMKMLNILSGEQVNPNTSFIILENIHLLEEPNKMLEFLFQQMSDYYICCTTFHHENILFNQWNYLNFCHVVHLFPLSFGEFLIVNKELSLYSKIQQHNKVVIEDNDRKTIEEYLKIYYFLGGMPLVVSSWLSGHDFDRAKKNKQQIIKQFEDEFQNIPSKALKNKVFEVWNSIASQLEKDNKKFQLGMVKLTARTREYNEAIEWLYQRRYISKLYKIKEAKVPITRQVDEKSYEIFMLDIGLLSEIFGFDYEQAKKDIALLSAYNNALNEQFVYQELLSNKNMNEFYYWTSEATARIEFIFEDSNQVIPIDINIDGNKKAQSLRVFKEKYHNPMSVRITYEKFSMDNGILNIPLYSVWNL